MSQELWTKVDDYFNGLLIGDDPVLEQALKDSEEAGLPPIQVAPNQGKLLYILAKAIGARKVLEIGTLGGYSTIWMARAIPADGRLITLEYEPKHAEVARKNLDRAGLSGVVDIRVGRAIDTLPNLESDGVGPFDLTFIDADKPSTAEYFEWAVRLSRVGSLVIVDNVVRQGEVANEASEDAAVVGMRRFNEVISHAASVVGTIVQTVGVKGHDGLAIALVASL